MPGSIDHSDLTDARLVAYLDGILADEERAALDRQLADDPALRQRLDLLQEGGRDFRTAFEPLLDVAPEARMQAMLQGLIKETGEAETETETVVPFQPRTAERKPRNFWSSAGGMAAAAAVTLAVFAGGLYTGWQTGAPPTAPQDFASIGWRQAAAQYTALFNKQTLAGFPTDAAEVNMGLNRVSAALGLKLDADNTAIQGLDFKGSQLLHLRGKPLAQLAYLGGGETPVALCIVKSAKPDSAPQTEQRAGQNIVHWIRGGYGYMLIGKVKADELKQLAAPLTSRFS